MTIVAGLLAHEEELGMAKPRKVIPARKDASRRVDDSLLVKSAESLGRVIGSLQRQVQGGSKQFSTLASDAFDTLAELPRFDDLFGNTKTAARKRTTSARKPRVRQTKTTRKAGAASTRKASGSKKRASARKTSKKR
jgi:hypothetical protein